MWGRGSPSNVDSTVDVQKNLGGGERLARTPLFMYANLVRGLAAAVGASNRFKGQLSSVLRWRAHGLLFIYLFIYYLIDFCLGVGSRETPGP
jgi:hypothetical protein